MAGSETERRGLKAKAHLLREMLDLCIIIHDLGEYHAKHRTQDDPDERDKELDDDGTIMVTFGELFQVRLDSTYINIENNKCRYSGPF